MIISQKLDTMKRLLMGFSAFVVLTILLVSCKDEEDNVTPDTNNDVAYTTVPSVFRVDVPDAISSNTGTSNRVTKSDVIDGKVVYQPIPDYIKVAEHASEIVETLIIAVGKYNLSSAQELEFVSDDDGRTKNITVTESATAFGASWEYNLIMKDADGGTALQLAWNNSPIKGVALFNPYELDRTENVSLKDALYQVEYDENVTDYDATMIVTIYNAPLDPNDLGTIDNMKMFVGKKGDNVDVTGTSNHPQLTFSSKKEAGLSYTFVARGSEAQDIGVIQAAIPYSSVTSTNNVFDNYSVYNVWADIIVAEFNVSEENAKIHLDKNMINAGSPAYFKGAEFQGAGTAPGDIYTEGGFDDLSGLTPYSPLEVKNLELTY